MTTIQSEEWGSPEAPEGTIIVRLEPYYTEQLMTHAEVELIHAYDAVSRMLKDLPNMEEHVDKQHYNDVLVFLANWKLSLTPVYRELTTTLGVNPVAVRARKLVHRHYDETHKGDE